MSMIDEIMQNVGKITRKFDSLSKVVDYVNEELIPSIFGDKTEKIFEMNKKAIEDFIAKI
jgi:hypothetical protein